MSAPKGPTKNTKRPRMDPSHSNSSSTSPNLSQSAVPGPGNQKRPSGHVKPHINPQIIKPGDMTSMSEELREAKFQDSLCELCSSKHRKIYHPHFSTQHVRDFSAKYRSFGTFNCTICKKEEPVEMPSNVTRRLVLSDSTLYNIWDYPELKVDQHFEIEAIVGGRVRDITRALDMMYLRDKPNRLEIIAVVSINNIGDGQSPDSIIQEMTDMKALVAEHSTLYNHMPPSYISFATCILPPKFCSFSVPPNVPRLAEWIPKSGFVNRADDIHALNIKIKQLNDKDGLRYIGLHLRGMKFFKNGSKQHKFDNLPEATKVWREHQVFRKLHFNQDIKVMIVNNIMSCFSNNSQILKG